MNLRIAVLCSQLVGCGSMGLTRLHADSGQIEIPNGDSWLVIDPQGMLDFGHVDVASGYPAYETLSLTAKGSGKVVIIDIRLDSRSSSAYSLAEPPLPHQLPVGVDYPVEIGFLPTHEVEYGGTVEIDIENSENAVETETIDVVGMGCDSQASPGCP